MNVYVINLDRAPERLERISTRLRALGIAFTRVAAVDGRRMTETERQAVVAPQADLAPGEIGCFLSHRECWNRIAAGTDTAAVVLEDDVHVSPDLRRLMEDAGWMPADADLVKLETRPGNRIVVDNQDIAVGDRTLARLRSAHLCTGGYVVSRASATRLLAASKSLAQPVDNFMFDPSSPVFRTLVTYQMNPAACVQEQFLDGAARLPDSGLESERKKRKLPVWRKLLREAARPLHQAREAATVIALRRRRMEIPFR